LFFITLNNYSTCTMEKCFSTHDNMDEVLQDIEGMKF